LVLDTAKILKETVTNADTVSSSAAQVTNASREQASGIKQITTAMEQLNKATQENASISEEAASSSEELSAQAETLRKLVAELNLMVKGRNAAIEDSQHSGPTQHDNVVNLKKPTVKMAPMKKAVGAENYSPTPGSNDEWDKL
ncbi:MAG: hypothetical protein WCG27_04185, partial [Pseudomonadota bacterium]